MANSLTFHVDESVWFKSGEEIENVLSLSIEPEIEIKENERFVTMTGSLRLDGEYERPSEPVELENERTLESSSFRIVHEVRQINDKFAQFLHRFPVEITIPVDRIQNINDVNVTVASFDYRLPEKNCLQLSAELVINGIQATDDEELKDYDFEQRVKDIYTADQISFSIDTKIDEDPTEDLEEIQENQAAELDTNQDHDGPQIELKSREEESDETEQIAESYEEERKIEEMVNQDSEDENQQIELEEKETQTRSDNALYLTKMLSRSEEEQFSKLKMRIIQPGDSLESIAKAYQLQPTQIARLNQLHDEQIEEGQILYIPVKSKQER